MKNIKEGLAKITKVIEATRRGNYFGQYSKEQFEHNLDSLIKKVDTLSNNTISKEVLNDFLKKYGGGAPVGCSE